MTVTGDMRPSTLEVHRYLDEAFAAVAVTPEIQDLKEEMRASLVARVAELEATGVTTDVAARRAMAELGDVRSVVDDLGAESDVRPLWRHERVRPGPAFVVRAVLLAVVATVGLAISILGATGGAIPLAGLFAAAAVLAAAAGALVVDSLRQETTTSYPLPVRRAVGYGTATTLAVAGVATAAQYLRHLEVAWLAGGALGLLAGIILFSYLAATQTNRHKPWVLRLRIAHEEAGDRFAHDPAAAARFGMYTVTMWTVALAGFAVLTITVGWAWSWLALTGGLVCFLVTLARMLFVPHVRNDA